jgi:hypothetical protein
MTGGGASPPDDSFADQAFAAAAEAYACAPGSWERAIGAAIAGLFDFLAERPGQTETCIVRDCGTGRAALARRDRTIARFADLLEPGFATAAAPPPPLVAEAIGGGIYEIVRSHVLERCLDLLPDAVPDATVVALSPFLGAAGAVALASAQSMQASG